MKMKNDWTTRYWIEISAVALALFQVGCSKQKVSPAIQEVTNNSQVYGSIQTTRPSPSSQVDPLQMNPFPVFSRNAQALKHPPGVDAVAYWGNGRFSIIGAFLYDEEKPGGKVVAGNITTFRYVDGIAYCKAAGGYLALELSTGILHRFSTKQEIPPKYSAEAGKLDLPHLPDNFVIRTATQK